MLEEQKSALHNLGTNQLENLKTVVFNRNIKQDTVKVLLWIFDIIVALMLIINKYIIKKAALYHCNKQQIILKYFRVILLDLTGVFLKTCSEIKEFHKSHRFTPFCFGERFC